MLVSHVRAILLLGAAASAWDFEARYSCGVCLDLKDRYLSGEKHTACQIYDACDVFNSSVIQHGCVDHCDLDQAAALWPNRVNTTTFDLRVSKGLGSKSYGSLRISVITRDKQKPIFNSSEFDYNGAFKYKWTENTLSSKMISVSAGLTNVTIGSTQITLQLPVQGAGVAGVLIADPCIRAGSLTALVSCTFAKKFQTSTRTPALLNAIMAHRDTDYWGILGDNFYDRNGHLTSQIYDELTVQTKSKIFLTVPGNHDYWVLGGPSVASKFDQFGHAHMQWYAQDTKAAEFIGPGDTSAPFDFSVDPSKGKPGQSSTLPAISNSFYYNQIGNVGTVGYSGAYTLNETLPLMMEACAWLGEQYLLGGIQLGLLFGHWDDEALGCQPDMAGPFFYKQMAQLPGCDLLDADRALKFFMGHTHCNIPHPHGQVDTGFMVAGQGMIGCGNYGLPVIDSTDSRVRVWYFDVVSQKGEDNYDPIIKCLRDNGWRKCTHLATLWLDQALGKQRS